MPASYLKQTAWDEEKLQLQLKLSEVQSQLKIVLDTPPAEVVPPRGTASIDASSTLSSTTSPAVARPETFRVHSPPPPKNARTGGATPESLGPAAGNREHEDPATPPKKSKEAESVKLESLPSVPKFRIWKKFKEWGLQVSGCRKNTRVFH